MSTTLGTQYTDKTESPWKLSMKSETQQEYNTVKRVNHVIFLPHSVYIFKAKIKSTMVNNLVVSTRPLSDYFYLLYNEPLKWHRLFYT